MKKAPSVISSILFASSLFFNSGLIHSQTPSRDNFNIIFENNFNDDAVGRYTVSDYNTDFRPQPTSLPDCNKMDIIQDSDPRYNRFMRGYFPKGTYLPDQHGFLFMSYLQNPVTELYFSYDVRFKEGFQWVKGGKIPGLTGGKIVSGVKPSPTDGWSARPVWQADGTLWIYIYHQDQYGIYGDLYQFKDFKFVSGKWYNITIRVVINTFSNNVAQYNGMVEGFINGKVYMQKSGLRLAGTPSVKIDDMYICSFFGGNTPDWATLNDEWVDTDNYVAYSYSNTATGVVRGNILSDPGKLLLHPYLSGVSTTGVPAAPSGLNNSLLSKNATTLNWSDNSSNETGFKLYRSLSETSGFTEIASLASNATSYTDNSLQPGTNYYYKLVAFNQSGNSAPTPVYMITTDLLDLPAAPTQFVSPGQTSSTVSLTWKDNSSREQGFQLYRSTSESNGFIHATSCEANETSCIDRSLQPGVNYYYKIRAFNADGYSDFTPVIKATTSIDAHSGTVHIDPGNTGDPAEDGSIQHPFDSWDDVSWKEGYTYLQLRGTTTIVNQIQIGADHISIGAYGEGRLPVISSETTTYLISGFQKSGIHIKDVELVAAKATSSIYFIGSSHDSIVVENCILTGSINAIKVLDATTLVARYNKIDSQNEGIFSTASGNEIYYNMFNGCTEAVRLTSTSSVARIYNNVFSDNLKSVLASNGELILYNNVYLLTKAGQMAVNQGAGKLTSDNNIYYPLQNGFMAVNGKTYDKLDEVQKQLKSDLKSFTSDPGFVDLIRQNYHLKPESPAINKGKNINTKCADFEGNKVPLFSTTDIGVYEFNGTLSIPLSDNENAFNVKVYPNPSQGQFTVEAELNDSTVQSEPALELNELKIVDITGKVVISKRISMDNTIYREEFDLTGNQSGLYFVVLRIAGEVIKEKLMIR